MATFQRDVVECFIWNVSVTLLGHTETHRYDVATTSCCQVSWFIMLFPIEKKQSCKRNFIASLSNDLLKTNWYPLFLVVHDAQTCFLIIMESLVPPLNTKSTNLCKISSSLSWGIFVNSVGKSNVFICFAFFPLLIFLIHSHGELFFITQKVLAALKCYGFLWYASIWL